jgi:predicted metal-binding transcription factor (methanogenesis marker protein 9)
MSEEVPLSEEELMEKKLQLCADLEEVGEKALSKKLFDKIAKEITFTQRDDWINEQICSLFPKDIDPRCLIWCCSPRNPCQFRAAVLRKLGLSLEDFIIMKAEFGEQINKIIANKK